MVGVPPPPDVINSAKFSFLYVQGFQTQKRDNSGLPICKLLTILYCMGQDNLSLILRYSTSQICSLFWQISTPKFHNHNIINWWTWQIITGSSHMSFACTIRYKWCTKKCSNVLLLTLHITPPALNSDTTALCSTNYHKHCGWITAHKRLWPKHMQPIMIKLATNLSPNHVQWRRATIQVPE